MAATLLEIKSKMLIPKPEEQRGEEEDPRDELVRRLIEYRRFKEAAADFREREEATAGRFFKEADSNIQELIKNARNKNADIAALLGGLTPECLYAVFEDVMNRRENRHIAAMDIQPVDNERHTLENKIESINGLLNRKKRILFSEVFDKCESRVEKVVTFLAVLELIRLLRVKIAQESLFGDIYIEVVYGVSENSLEHKI